MNERLVPRQVKRIVSQTIVKLDGRTGVAVTDPFSCCADIETPVVFYGEASYVGVPTALLEVVGPENAVAVFEKCGAGREKECCAFLAVGPTGACCERYSELRTTILFKVNSMSAQRMPIEPYPACQKFDGPPPGLVVGSTIEKKEV